MLTHTDPAELPEASCTDDPSQHVSAGLCRQCGNEFDVQCPHCRSLDTIGGEHGGASDDELMRRFRRVILRADEAQSPRFYIRCLLMAIGDPAAEGKSLASLAREWRSTRAVVSKYCRQIIKDLGVKPSPYMMSELTAEVHRKSNKRQIKLKA